MLKLYIFLLLLVPLTLHSQTKKIDSLKLLIGTLSNNEKKLDNIFLLCEERQSIPNDTLGKYALQAGKIAAYLKNTTLSLKAGYYYNICLLKKGFTDSVIQHCDEVLHNLKDKDPGNMLELEFMQLKSLALMRSNLFEKAIAEHFQLLQKAEVTKDTLMQIKAKNGIGWGYMEMSQYTLGIEWFLKALSTAKNNLFYDKYTAVYDNIASCYNNISRFDSALFYINKALTAVGRFSDLTSQANALNIKADIFINTRKTKQAEALLKQALDIRTRIGDPFYIVSDYFQLAVFYAHNGEPQKGISTALTGIEKAKQYHLTSKMPLLYTGLAESYKMAGDVNNYAKTLETIITLKDSLYEKNSAEAVAALQSRYEVQKNQNIIIQQKLDILKRDYFIAGTAFLMLLVIFATIYWYNKYKKRQTVKLREILAIQKENEVSAVTEAEENQRKRIAAELHDNMGSLISFISSNIDWIINAPTPLTKQEQKQRLQMVHETSRGLMLALRETIWALSRDKISLEEFADKLKAYIQGFLQFHPGLHFQSGEELKSPVILKPLLALNIFRIFQEAVNNAIKYSNATNLWLRISSNKSEFEIMLQDNGDGFDSKEVEGEHYGLQIMKHRASEAGLAFTLESDSGSGTAITLSGKNINKN